MRASFLPATEPERWSRSRIDWPGAARMAAARRSAGLPLSDTDREALRRVEALNDEGRPRHRTGFVITNLPDANQARSLHVRT